MATAVPSVSVRAKEMEETGNTNRDFTDTASRYERINKHQSLDRNDTKKCGSVPGLDANSPLGYVHNNVLSSLTH